MTFYISEESNSNLKKNLLFAAQSALSEAVTANNIFEESAAAKKTVMLTYWLSSTYSRKKNKL